MRIYDVSCNTYSNQKSNPTFGFWQPSMARVERESERVLSAYTHKATVIPKDGIWLKGKIGETLDLSNLDMYKKRHVNITGSRDKIERRTFNRYSPNGIVERYQQDLYPDGNLITIIKTICSKGIQKIEKFIENIK